jgi:hypothetical protein
VKRLGPRDLLTERLVLKWRFIAGHDMLGKSIVKPHRVRAADVHRCKLRPGYSYADTNPGMASDAAAAKIHHYWSRDERYLVEAKLPRAARIKGWVIDAQRVAFFKTLFNDVPDHGMKRFAAELRRRVFGRRARPAPGDRHRTARARRPASRPR